MSDFFQNAIFSQGRRRASAAGGGGSGISSLAEVTGCIGNWRADTGLTFAGSNVTRWNDISSYGNFLTGSSGPTRTLSNSDFNGQPTLDFNGSTQFLSSSGYVPQNGGSGADQTGASVVMIYRQKRQNSYEINFFWGEADTQKFRLSNRNSTETDQFINNVSVSGSNAETKMGAAQPFNITSSYTMIMTYERAAAGQLNILQNGVYSSNTPSTLSNKWSEGRITVGKQVYASNFSNMSVAEIALYKLDLTKQPGVLSQILDYANTRYGIASGSF